MDNSVTETHRTLSFEDVQKHKDLIYDVGLHKGEDTEFYLRKGFRVIAFEADPDLAQSCRERFKDFIDSGKLTIVEGAILDPDSAAGRKTVQFFKSTKNSVWGTISTNWAERSAASGSPTETIEIEIVDFVAALQKYGIPHYLKVDIEGVDMVCVNALKRFRERPDFVSIESSFHSFSEIQREMNTFVELGYDAFQVIEQSAVPQQIAPTPPSEGQYAAQHFEEGCTGLFGVELGPGWQTEQATLHRYRGICFAIRVMGIVRKWKFRGSNRLRAMTAKTLARMTGENPWGWFDTHARHRSVTGS